MFESPEINVDGEEVTSYKLPQEAILPSYFNALDAHNYGNKNFAFTDPSTYADGIGSSGKFLLAATFSGAVGIRNSLATIGTFFGSDIEQVDISTSLAAVDSDLGAYYESNKQMVDIGGFVLSSLVTGLGGIKVFNAGQKVLQGAIESGTIGGTLGKTLGLLTPRSSALLTQAAGREIAAGNAAFSFTNANVINALKAGIGQQALEGAAFETAVIATNFKSPVLEDSDGWDLAKNILIGAAFGGAFGVVIEGSRTYFGVKRIVQAADLEAKNRTFIEGTYKAMSPSERIIAAADQIDNAQPIPTGLQGPELAKATAQYNTKISKLNGQKREAFREMSSSELLGNQMADFAQGRSGNETMAAMLHADEITRIGEKSALEKEVKDLLKLGPQTPEVLGPYQTQLIKLHGENAGTIIADSSTNVVPNLADVVTFGKKAGVESGIRAAVRKYQFKPSQIWDITKATSHFEAEARYIWAEGLKREVFKDGMKIGDSDIPLMEAAWRKWQKDEAISGSSLTSGVDKKLIQNINLVDDLGKEYSVSSSDELYSILRKQKIKSAISLVEAGQITEKEAIAKMVNVRTSRLNGEASVDEADDLFAREYNRRKLNEDLIARGVRKNTDPALDPTYLPSYAKVSYKIDDSIRDLDGNVVRGAAFIKAKQKLYQEQLNNVVANWTTEFYDRFIDIPENLIRTANRYGAGPGLASSAQGGYGSLESVVQQIGAASAELKASFRKAVGERINSAALKLAENQNAAIEVYSINNKVLSTSEHYILSEDGTELVARKILDWDGNGDMPALQPGAPERIAIESPEAREFFSARVDTNGRRITGRKEILAAQGKEYGYDSRTYYPLRPNPKDYQHFAIIVDPRIASGSAFQKSMIHAASEKELQSLLDRVPAEYQRYTKGDMERFYKEHGEFNYDESIHENYIDSDLRRAGVSSSFFTPTNPQKLASDWTEAEMRAEDTFARELVHAKYEKEFSELRRLGEEYTNVAQSKFAGTEKFSESSVKNPYTSYIKTALDISQFSESKYLYSASQALDRWFSQAIRPIQESLAEAKHPTDLDKINTQLNKMGMRTAYASAADVILANHSAPRGVLNNFVRRANSILGSLTLGLDPLNALNNAVGSTILLGTETRSLINAIKKGNKEVAGELGELANVLLPSANGASILSPAKIIAKQYSKWVDPTTRKELVEFMQSKGFDPDVMKQINQMYDDLTLRGSEKAADLDSRIGRAFENAKKLNEKGILLTGNKHAETLNRFVAVGVMKDITDLAIKAGVLDPKQQLSYINTFVNRTQGTYLASQRPLMFQGAIGQAVGLFQTYQFNLMQQLFRYVGTGSGKDAAFLLGLQGTIYGLNGLPAFNYINTHIVGTNSGNPQHTDLYAATYGIFGKSVGNLLTYGIPSNLLQTNLYSRGDINPRQVTVIPANPVDIPIVNAYSGFIGNIYNTAMKLGQGGAVWETLLSGIEHNGISRPLAGIAQVARAATNEGMAFSTSRKGTILGSNDLFEISTISRLAGGRPLDEAIANDATYRTSVYKAMDQQRKIKLKQAVKSQVIGTGVVDIGEYEGFAAKYAELGGDSKRFNQYMMKQITEANQPLAEKIMVEMKGPYAQNMQYIMGGADITTGGAEDPEK